MKTIIAVCLLLVAQAAADAGVHRLAVDVTVQRCTALTCKVGREKWQGSVIAIGRRDGVEYFLTNRHAFVGGKYFGGVSVTVRQIHSIKIETFDAGSFDAELVGSRDGKGVDGVDLALLSVRSSKRWNSYAVASTAPSPKDEVSVEGWPGGRYKRRSAVVSGFTREYGMRTSGIAKQGESGGAVLFRGELAGVVWGSRVGLVSGTYATPAPDVRRFLLAEIGFVPGSVKSAPPPPPPTSRRPPVRTSSRCSDCAKRLADLERQVADLQRKPAGIRSADLAGLRAGVAELRGLTVPIRIETNGGEIIAERKLGLVERNGKLELSPIVLKFDEKILRGSVD